MDEIIKARVWWKVATEAEWNANTMILGPGEPAVVVSENSGAAVQMKWGDGTKRFSDLPWFIQPTGVPKIASPSMDFSLEEPGMFIPNASGNYGPNNFPVDISDGYTVLIWNGSQVSGAKFPIDLSGYATSSDLNSVSSSLLAVGVNDPLVISGRYIDKADNGYKTNSNLSLYVWKIVTGSIKRVRIRGTFNVTPPYYYSEFSGDYTSPSNFVKGSALATSGETPIDTWITIEPATEYILTAASSTGGGHQVTITEWEVSDSYKNDGYKQLLIGVNEPVRVEGRYINESGNEANNGTLHYKWFEIVKGSISEVRVVGEVNFSMPMWFAQWSDSPRNDSTFLGGLKLPVTGLTSIDQWIEIHEDVKYFSIGTENVRTIDVVDVRVAKSKPVPSVGSYGVDYSQIIDIGAISHQNVGGDICHLICYGQSLAATNSPSRGVTTAVAGNYMFGQYPVITPNGNMSYISPLASSANQGETPIVSATNHFSRLWRRFRTPDQEFYANSAARGSMSIEVLSKESTNEDWYENGVNTYTKRFINLITQAKGYADTNSKTIRCPAIVYMQGENNYSGTGQGLTTGSDQTRDKNAYKALLVTLKNNMQADIMSVYEQDERPLFFIYQTGRIWNNTTAQAATMAQLEFAAENEDVILVNPCYQVPGMRPTSDHMSSNGVRWFGELLGKAMFETFIKGQRASVIIAKKANIVDAFTIDIKFKVPVQPLVIDTHYSIQKANAGYYVSNAGNSVTIDSVGVVGGDTIRLSLSNPLVVGNVAISYAGGNTDGKGNIRDSDNYGAMYDYTDYTSIETAPEEYVSEDSDGNPMYGHKYPLCNWASHHYFLINYGG